MKLRQLEAMKNQSKSRLIQHILVALDASPHSLTALEAAAELAQTLQAELIGIFVEDVNLLKLAGLPFAQEIHFPKATTHKLDTIIMEKRLQEQAHRAKEIMRQIAERELLDWTFRVARGVVTAELLAAAMDADMLVLGRTSRQLNRGPLGSTARTAIAQSKPPVLLLGSEFDLNRPLLLFYDGSAVAQTALNIAAELAQESGYLGVLLWSEGDKARQYQAEVIERLLDFNLIVNFRNLLESEKVAGIIERSTVGLLVIGDTGTPFIRGVIETVLEETQYPVLVVR
jgi:nucleotide-binding universal stress UspA family protein